MRTMKLFKANNFGNKQACNTILCEYYKKTRKKYYYKNIVQAELNKLFSKIF